MVNKKSSAKKKADKQRERQKLIQQGVVPEIGKSPCNLEMICDQCQRRQKNRAFCYFCQAVQRLPICAQCGKQKCFATDGLCLVKHVGSNVSGMAMVGAVCDFCEAWVCHSRKCIQTHGCVCPLKLEKVPVTCEECKRDVWDHGGRVFQCASCSNYLCEDDQFEHQAQCQQLQQENYKCVSCSKFGEYACMKCKCSWCFDHYKGNLYKSSKENAFPCKKCGFELVEAKAITLSVRRHEYGRQQEDPYY